MQVGSLGTVRGKGALVGDGLPCDSQCCNETDSVGIVSAVSGGIGHQRPDRVMAAQMSPDLLEHLVRRLGAQHGARTALVSLVGRHRQLGPKGHLIRQTRPTAPRPAENPVMTWDVKGTYIETCSCDFFCPCNFSFAHGADYDRCRVTLVFNITEGDVEGTDVGGLVVAVVADTPKVMTEGNWRVGVLIDDKASDEQADKLVGVFSGQLGGPMAALGPLIGENLGVQRATIEVQENGLRHSVRIGDAVDFEIEDVVPFGNETGEPVRVVGMFHPAGSEFRVAEAKRANINAFGIAYEGKSGLSAPQFSWAA